MRKFWKDKSGSVGIMFALGAIPISIAVGFGIDYGRISMAISASQNALDQATLAAASVNASKSLQKYEQFFRTNTALLETTFSNFKIAASSTGVYTAQVSANIPTPFMSLVGLKSLDVPLKAQAAGVKVDKLSQISVWTTAAKGWFDKDIYFVTRDAKGAVLSRTLILQYDFHPDGSASFTPQFGATFTMDVPDYNSWAIEMITYVDWTAAGRKINPAIHYSDDADAASWQKISGSCDDPLGQSQSWEDLGDLDYKDFQFVLTCKMVTQNTGQARLL